MSNDPAELAAVEAAFAAGAELPFENPVIADMKRRFTYHRPEGKKIEDHEDVRHAYLAFAQDFLASLPDGREKSLAITNLEESSFWAHAAIAREGK